MYRDNSHFPGSFADSLMPVLQAQMLPILTDGPENSPSNNAAGEKQLPRQFKP